MINFVIPMAGMGSRFSDKGYKLPKPLIDVLGKPMIQRVVENLNTSYEHRFIFICQNRHINDFKLLELFQKIAPGYEAIGIDGYTEGAACTVLKAKELINNDDQLIIANSDQWINANMNDFINDWYIKDSHGHIMTMKSSDSKWSYVKFDNHKKVLSVVEKVVVSDEATVGIYCFKTGRDYIKHCEKMIEENNRSKGEFYVAPVYDYLIKNGNNISLFNIGDDEGGMYGLGTPDDLGIFINSFKDKDF